MFERELIEQLNDIDNRWRDKFSDVWVAAAYHGLLDENDHSHQYEELNFE